MRKTAVLRIRILTGFVLFLALLLVGRLYQLQILQKETYLAKAEKQYVHTVEDLYDRGSIFFTTKDGQEVSAATIQAGFLLAVDPSELTDAESAYSALAAYIDLDHETFIHRATLPERTYVEIDSMVSGDNAKAIEALDITGVHLYRNQWRYYPGGTLAARTIGFIGYGGDGDDVLSGRYGLERYYDDVLQRTQERLSVNFFAEMFSNFGSMVFDSTPQRRGDIVTTIEPTVARMLQNELLSVNDQYQSELTGGIIINPKNGEIYALDAVPTFDLNDRGGASIQDFQNPLIEDVYELGSIIKALTMASGLDSGAVGRWTTYYDPGRIELDTFTISNYDGRGRGTVPMQEVLNQSLNTGVAFVVDTMGKKRFRDYFLNLKLGSETGIDLPNETHGLVQNLNSPRDVEYATASFGQGIALTPIAAVRALSTLGNGGVLITPHIVKSINYTDGTSKEVNYPEGARVFSEDTSEEISRMLVTVVDDALKGGTVALPDYTIAAKTGTAQIADQVNGGYYDDRYLHSFFGYFPAYDPEYLVFLYTVEPKNVSYASETLTDPFMEIAKFLINYYSVPPDR
ncbi:penicillin-binding protein 2 [Candidatus Kaiserbacteria bacterium]|nr:penicillin-binding protein 2 [Candidatus Kaiserbacteria bacterium]MCB9811941.1 penicillin-binding protein 2 [Candidatus Nomurabacteria bacterium]